MFRTGAQFVFVVLLTGLLLINQSRTEPLAAWENSFADFLAVNSRRYAAPAPVVLVAIDDASLADHPWPWNPLQYSLFFQAALPLKPEAICIDQVLDWERALVLPEDQNRKLPQYEKLLRGGILRAPKMLLGATLGLPADPAWADHILEIVERKKRIEEIDGIGCQPVLITATTDEMLEWIGEGFVSRMLSLPGENGPIIWPRYTLVGLLSTGNCILPSLS